MQIRVQRLPVQVLLERGAGEGAGAAGACLRGAPASSEAEPLCGHVHGRFVAMHTAGPPGVLFRQLV